MKHPFTFGATALLAGLMLSPIALAQNGEQHKKLDSQESAFLRQAAQSDVFEQRLGQYAAEHAATDKVKQLGKEMAQDHQQDLQKVEDLAKNHGVDLGKHDREITPEQKTIYDRLTSKPGINFDKDYTKLLTAEHSRMVSEYQRERDQAHDVDVREYAGNTLPTLQHHLDLSKDAQKTAWGH